MVLIIVSLRLPAFRSLLWYNCGFRYIYLSIGWMVSFILDYLSVGSCLVVFILYLFVGVVVIMFGCVVDVVL